jgi:hypothetical protein
MRDKAGTPYPDELCIRNKAGNASRPYPDESCIQDQVRDPYPDEVTGHPEGSGLRHLRF